MRRLSLAFAAVLAVLASGASAQVVPFGTFGGSGGGGGVPSSIPSGTSTDCTALSVWRTSAGQLLECGLGLTYSNGVIAAGTASSLRGGLDLFGATHAFSTRFQVSESQGAGITYTLPTTDGGASEFLQTNGSGALTWAAVSSTITSGTTATSGCVAGGVLRSISNLVQCGAGLSLSGTELTVGSGAAGSITFGTSGVIIAAASSGLRITANNGTFGIGGPDNGSLIFASGLNGIFGQGVSIKAYSGSAWSTMFAVTNAAAPTVAMLAPVTITAGSAQVPLTLNNGANAVSPLVVQDNGTPVLTVADGGATTFTSSVTANALNIGAGGYTLAGTGALTGNVGISSANAYLCINGTMSAPCVSERTAMTPDAPVFESGTESNSWHVFEGADDGYDFNNGACGTSACTDPAYIIHSSAQDTTQYNHMAAWGQAGGAVKALTESAATALVRIPVANNGRASGILYYEIYATDGTDMQTRTSSIRYAMSNKAGTETCTLTAMDGVAATAETDDDNASDITAGTLTYGIACTNNAANTMDITFNAVSSLTQTTLQATWSVKHLSPGAPARQ